MIAITKLKIDDKGRVTLPYHFLKANNIEKGTYISMYPVYNREDSVRLQFECNLIDKENDEWVKAKELGDKAYRAVDAKNKQLK